MNIHIGQTKIDSFIEACFNVFVGFIINLGAQFLIYPIFNIDISVLQYIEIAAIFTVISILKTYVIRRIWNKKLINKHKKSGASNDGVQR